MAFALHTALGLNFLLWSAFWTIIVVFLSRSNSANNNNNNNNRQTGLAANANANSSMRQPQNSAPPAILLLGLPRSGSESIHNWFSCVNDQSLLLKKKGQDKKIVSSHHYCCDGSNRTRFPCANPNRTCGACVHDNMLNGRPALDGCAAAIADKNTQQQQQQQQIFATLDVETGGDPYSWFLPQHFALPLLVPEQNDNNSKENAAIWILNSRKNAADWATHILHWYSITRRLFHAFGLEYYDYNDADNPDDEKIHPFTVPQHPMTEESLRRDMEVSLQRSASLEEHQRRHQLLQDIYQAHTQRVQSFVTNNLQPKNSVRLISVAVDDPPQLVVQSLWQTLVRDSKSAPPSEAIECWNFDSNQYGADWKDFSLRL